MIAETRKYTITKNKPYFILPIEDYKEGAVITAFKPEQFGAEDKLKVRIKSELRDKDHYSEAVDLMNFHDEYVENKKLIPFEAENGERYILITLFIGVEKDGQFVEAEKIDLDKIQDFKIIIEYTYKRSRVAAS